MFEIPGEDAKWAPINPKPERIPLFCRWFGHQWMEWTLTGQHRCRRCLIFRRHPKPRPHNVRAV